MPDDVTLQTSHDFEELPLHLQLLSGNQRKNTTARDDAIQQELIIYRNMPVVHANTNPLEWWSQCTTLPLIKAVIPKYLSIQPTSIASERLFSAAGLVLSALRTRMNDTTFKQSLNVKINSAKLKCMLTFQRSILL